MDNNVLNFTLLFINLAFSYRRPRLVVEDSYLCRTCRKEKILCTEYGNGV